MESKYVVSKEFIDKVKSEDYKDIIRLIISTIYGIPRFDLDYDKIKVNVINNDIKIYYEEVEILNINTL